ncbi:MAG: hypothetical protein ACJZ8M_04110 [Pseudohongiellaceae bacterium]|tara:strand:- start:1083 stop:1571 length:489 start_codon:yes stop_codon:yes gene_type:complete
MIEALTEEMMASNLTQWIQATYWLWPILEIFHFFGLTLLMGGLIIVDLRMIGFLSYIGLEEVKKLLPLVIFGFLVNLITGVLFLFGDPSRYSINIGFQIKMILVLLAGCNAAIYHLKVEPLFSNLNLTDRLPLAIKITGFTSLTLWAGVLLLGRLIPYVGTG